MATQLRSHARRYICANNSSLYASRYPVGARSFSSLSQGSAQPRTASGVGAGILCVGVLFKIFDWIDPLGKLAAVRDLKETFCRFCQTSMVADLKKVKREIDGIRRNQFERAFKEGNTTGEALITKVE